MSANPCCSDLKTKLQNSLGLFVHVTNKLGTTLDGFLTGVDDDAITLMCENTAEYIAKSDIAHFTAVPLIYATIANAVRVINTSTNKMLGMTIPAGRDPYGIAISPYGSLLYVTNMDSNTVSVLDTLKKAATKPRIPTGPFPQVIALTPSGLRAYVVNANDTVTVISTPSREVIATINAGRGARSIEISPNGSRAYVTNYIAGTVSVIDTATNSVIGTITVGTHPTETVITPDGSYAYVANRESHTVSVIDTATNLVLGDIPIPVNSVFMAINPNGSKIYVSHTSWISVISTTTNTVINSIGVEGIEPLSIAITPDGSRIYAAYYYPSVIIVINTETNQVIDTIPTQDSCYGMAVTPLRFW